MGTEMGTVKCETSLNALVFRKFTVAYQLFCRTSRLKQSSRKSISWTNFPPDRVLHGATLQTVVANSRRAQDWGPRAGTKRQREAWSNTCKKKTMHQPALVIRLEKQMQNRPRPQLTSIRMLPQPTRPRPRTTTVS